VSLPRTDVYTPLVGSIPSDGALWIPGDHVAVDKVVAAYGTLNRYGRLDTGVIYASSTVPASSWMACRALPPTAEVRVRSRFFWRHVAGDRQPVTCGVMARLQNISGTATGPERWFEGDAYILEVAIDPETELAELAVYRVDQGVKTSMQSVSDLAWPEDKNRIPELRVNDLGDGSVRLSAILDGDIIFRVVDPAASALTGIGACGFLTSCGKTTDGQTRASIREIEIDQLDGTAVMSDDFDRPNRLGSSADYYLRSLWHVAAGAPTSGGQLSYGSETGDRIVLFQVRPATADYEVQADVTFPNFQRQWIGFVARAGKPDGAEGIGGFTGYLAALKIGSSTDNVQLWKYLDGDVEETASFDAGGFSANVAIALKLTVETAATQTTLQLRANGTLIGSLIDKSLTQLVQPGQVGFYLARPIGSTGSLKIDNFELTDGSAEEDEFENLPIADEDVGAIPRYFQFGVDLSDQIDGVRTVFDLPVTPAGAASVVPRHNGHYLERTTGSVDPGKYSVQVGDATITLGVAPQLGDTLRVDVAEAENEDLVLNEVPVGTKDGNNRLFAIATAPYAQGAIRVRHNGRRVHYQETWDPGDGRFAQPAGKLVLLGTAPFADDVLEVDYVKVGAVAHNPVFGAAAAGTRDGSNRRFVLPFPPNSPSELVPVLSGYSMTPGDPSTDETAFSVSGNVVTLGLAPNDEDDLECDMVRADLFESTLSAAADYVISASEEFASVVRKFESGHVESFPMMTKGRRTLQCTFGNRPKAEADALVDFFKARRGPYQQFSWLAPDDEVATSWHLRNPEVKKTMHATGVYSVTVVLEELVTFHARAA